MSKIVFQIDPTPENARNSEGSFVTLKDGRILFAWTKFLSDGGDHGKSVIASLVSDDGGKTWPGEDRVLARPEGGAHNLMSVSLLRLQDDRIMLLYLRKTNLPDGQIQCTPVVQFSQDEMASLSSPIPVTPSKDFHIVNNDRVIQLQDGTIVVPVAHHRDGLPILPARRSDVEEFRSGATIFYILSRDGGATWYESETEYHRALRDGGGLQEPGVIELNDGRLWSWTRSTWQQDDIGRCQWQSFSDDGGRTWREPEPSIFVSPCSPLSMKRIPFTGDLLAVWNDHSGRFPTPEKRNERRPLVCAVSSDEGTTWKHHRVLEDDPEHGYCYTAIHFVDDAVLLAYCAGGPRPAGPLTRLRMRRIPICDLYL